MKKFISFLAFACLIALFSNSTLSQTRRKTTTSTKRAATTNKASSKRAAATSKTSTKRAAVSSTSTKRAATSSATRRRAATSSASTKRVAARRAATNTSSSKTSATNSNTCPIGVVIKKVEENGNNVYYSAKDNVCSEPENVMGTQGTNGLSLPTWIAGKDAYVFSCNYGFVKSKKDNVDICIDQNTICPLDTTISKKDNKYINPLTGNECSLPASASTLKLTEDTNTDSTIPTDEAYYSFCNKNYYSTSDTECKACPTGKYTIGATIRYTNITDSENKVVGTKAMLVSGATSEEDCYTQEEINSVEWDENGNMIMNRKVNYVVNQI